MKTIRRDFRRKTITRYIHVHVEMTHQRDCVLAVQLSLFVQNHGMDIGTRGYWYINKNRCDVCTVHYHCEGQTESNWGKQTIRFNFLNKQ